nr:hypothetical protein [Trichormus variabilis]
MITFAQVMVMTPLLVVQAMTLSMMEVGMTILVVVQETTQLPQEQALILLMVEKE